MDRPQRLLNERRDHVLVLLPAQLEIEVCYVTFQMAEVVVSARMFQEILPLIAGLRAPPAPA
jgi:hypothetical protein